MRLRAKWTDESDYSAVLNVDTSLPTYPILCNCPVCVSKRSIFSVIGGDQSHPDHEEKQLDPHDQELVDGIMGVNGVTGVSAHEYQCRVSKGAVFSWEEMKPRIESVIAQWAGLEPPQPEKAGVWTRLKRLLGRGK